MSTLFSEIHAPLPILVNPASGRGAGARMAPLIAAAARAAGLDAEIILTTHAGNGAERAAEFAARGVPIVAAAGGDGMISEVAAALYGTRTALAVLPSGTGNDLARHLGIPLKTLTAVAGLNDSIITPMDVGVANGHAFIVASGAGFDAAVAREVNQGMRWAKGSAAYAIALLRVLFRYRPTALRVEVDGVASQFNGYFAVAANVKTYGGGMRIAPDASVVDGLADICCVRSVSRLGFVIAASRVYSGKHVSHPAVTMLKGKCIVIESTPPAPVNVDGDVRTTTPLVINMSAGALEVVVPVLQQHPYEPIPAAAPHSQSSGGLSIVR